MLRLRQASLRLMPDGPGRFEQGFNFEASRGILSSNGLGYIMSIRLKIALSYLALILIFVGLGVYVIYSERFIAAQLDRLDEQFEQTALGRTELDQTAHLLLDMQTSRLVLHELLLGETDAQQEFLETTASFDQHHDQLAATHEAYLARAQAANDPRLAEVEANRSELEAIAAQHEHFHEDAAITIDLVNDGQLDQAKTLLNDELEGELAALQERIRLFETAVEQQMERASVRFDESVHAVEGIVARLRTTSIALIMVSVLLAIGLSAWIGKLITDPMNDLSTTAESIEQGSYKLDRLPPMTGRRDEFGLLARVFQRMANEVHTREQRLKEQVQQLRIRIDSKKQEQQVAEVTETDFFQALEAKASQLRQRKSGSRPVK
ncbi:MAG TPA: HAMP domain-containing protein [Anaerolineae bacterium]